MTASTDGSVAFWALSHPGRLLGEHQRSMPSPVPTGHHFVHQSSIKALAICPLTRAETLLITGGDDNALAITRVVHTPKTPDSEDSGSASLGCATLLVPRAHASAVNAIALMSHVSTQNGGNSGSASSHTVFATTGNDQLVKTWAITVDSSRAGVDGIQVRKQDRKCSAIADAACMDVMEETHGAARAVIVAGIGIEEWDWGAEGLGRSTG